MRALTEDLVRINSEAKAETREDRLLLAIEATKPTVNNFGTVAQAVAEWDSKDALHGLVQGFEYLGGERALGHRRRSPLEGRALSAAAPIVRTA